MRRFLILILALLSYSANAQRLLKHTLIPSGRGGPEIMACKITDYQLLVNCWSGGQHHNFVYLNANGDTIKSQYKRIDADLLIRVNNNGVFMALNLMAGFNVLKGLTYDSNGTQMGAFRHVIGDPLLQIEFSYLDSYTDSAGNVVLHMSGKEGWPPKDRLYHFTFNPFGQLVKIKDYGLMGPTTFLADFRKGSKLLVKDGKLWGFTTVTDDGVIGWGIDTAGLTGQSYFLAKTRNLLSGGNGYMTVLLPYKNGGYYTSIQRGSMIKTCKSDIMGVPIQTDSGIASRRFFDLWVSADSSRINAYWPNITIPWPPSANNRIVRRIDHLGNIMGSISLPESLFLNSDGFFCFGDGSWINIGQNPGALTGVSFPYMLTRISDMGYPYDPWKQQVVFKGVTGTEAQVKEKPKVIAYPNPTTDNLRFMGIAEGQVRLIDATGKTVLTSPLTAEGISLAHLPRGLYLYQLHYRNQTFQGRVVRE